MKFVVVVLLVAKVTLFLAFLTLGQVEGRSQVRPCAKETRHLTECLEKTCPSSACKATFHYHDFAATETRTNETTLTCAEVLANSCHKSYRACCSKCSRQESAVGLCLRRDADRKFAKCQQSNDTDHASHCFSRHGCPPVPTA